MPAIPADSIRTISRKRATPSLLDGSVGAISLSAGTVNTPQIASPSQLQYIAQPTSLGAQVGQAVATISGQVNDLALKMAIKKAKAAAESKAVSYTDELWKRAIGTNEKAGILLKKGNDFLTSYDSALVDVNQFIQDSAAMIPDKMERSFFLAEMASSRAAVKTQLRNKYKSEYTAAVENTRSDQSILRIQNAMMSAGDPAAVHAFLKAEQIAKIQAGMNDIEAWDETMVQFATAMTTQPDGQILLKGVLENSDYDFSVSYKGQIGIWDAIADDLSRKADAAKDEVSLAEANEKKFWSGIYKNVHGSFNDAIKADGGIDPVHIEEIRLALRKQVADYDTYGNIGKQIDAMAKTMATSGPPSRTVGAILGNGRLNHTPPWEIQKEADAMGQVIPFEAFQAYQNDFYAVGSGYVSEAVKDFEEYALSTVAQAAGLNPDAGQFYMATPEGRQLVNSWSKELYQKALKAYTNPSLGGRAGVDAAVLEYKAFVSSSQPVSDFRAVSLQGISYLPEAFSPIKGLGTNIVQDKLSAVELSVSPGYTASMEAIKYHMQQNPGISEEQAMIDAIQAQYYKWIDESDSPQYVRDRFKYAVDFEIAILRNNLEGSPNAE